MKAGVPIEVFVPDGDGMVELVIAFEHDQYITVTNEWNEHQELAVPLREFFDTVGITREHCLAAFEEVNSVGNSPFGPMQSPVGGTPYLGMQIFPLGAIITASDVSVDDWDIMEAMAFEAGCRIRPTKLDKRCVEGRVLIQYEGHVYKTTCRYGELRFKRMT